MNTTSREAWLEWRRNGLGGSDVAAVLGLSPFAGPWDVYLSKVQRVDTPDSPAMERGRRFERAIADWAADLLELGVIEPGAPAIDDEHDWIRGTPDFYLQPLKPGQANGLECKTTRYLDPAHWGAPGTDKIPIGYRIQCAWYMRIAGLPCWHVAVFSTLQDRLELYCVERDLEIEQRLVERAGHWWHRHIVNKEPPALDGSAQAGRWLRSQHPTAGDTMLEADAEIEQIATRIRELQHVEKLAQAERAELENRVKSRIGDAKGIAGEFGSFKWSRYTSKRLDGKRLRKERPEIAPLLDEYTNNNPAARLWSNWSDKT